MFFAIRRVLVAIVGGLVAIGFLSGCVTIDPKPTLPSVNVTMPTIAPIPIDTTKPLEVHAEEWKNNFLKNVYCPLRNTPIADAVADEGKRLWNEFAAEAQRQGVPIPEFNPADPKNCQ